MMVTEPINCRSERRMFRTTSGMCFRRWSSSICDVRPNSNILRSMPTSRASCSHSRSTRREIYMPCLYQDNEIARIMPLLHFSSKVVVNTVSSGRRQLDLPKFLNPIHVIWLVPPGIPKVGVQGRRVDMERKHRVSVVSAQAHRPMPVEPLPMCAAATFPMRC